MWKLSMPHFLSLLYKFLSYVLWRDSGNIGFCSWWRCTWLDVKHVELITFPKNMVPFAMETSIFLMNVLLVRYWACTCNTVFCWLKLFRFFSVEWQVLLEFCFTNWYGTFNITVTVLRHSTFLFIMFSREQLDFIGCACLLQLSSKPWSDFAFLLM